jgi:succinylglutamate desuccinylase
MRYVDKDLNRQWTPERVAMIRDSRPEERVHTEDEEMYELLQVLEVELGDAKGDAYFIDLHTTSAEGVPFVLFGDTLRNRAFALQIPLPVILGLEEQLDGTLLEYVNSQGYVTLGCEGGQHRSEDAANNHEALIWLALRNAGCVEGDGDRAAPWLERLRLARGRLPRVIEVRYRHAITEQDDFRMQPGFTNFDRVESGQLLARDAQGEVRARWSGWLLMPLYQGQGNDGFFLANEVHGVWLAVSGVVRRLRLSGLLRLLPGVTRHKGGKDSLIVDTRVARWFPLDIFRLFGFRKLRWHGPVLVVSRRPYDLAPPR